MLENHNIKKANINLIVIVIRFFKYFVLNN